MIKVRRLKTRAIANTVRDYINEELGAALELSTCEVGAQWVFHGAVEDDLPMILVRVVSQTPERHPKKNGAIRVVTELEIAYFRILGEDEEPEVNIYDDADEITELFLRDEYEWPFDLKPVEGLCIEETFPGTSEFVPAGELDIHERIEQVTIPVRVQTEHPKVLKD